MACAKTISFPKGTGSLRHNNREFIADNVDQERIHLNRIYKKETIEEAYEKCFGEALREYNARQKRKDRIKEDYIKEIRNSGNGQKVFYESIVQIGTKEDTGVKDEKGDLTEEALKAAEILEEYVKTFQERNPNLYLFNAVLHMDEATPHLHLDYIPVAHGYKRGMSVQNSLSRGLQEQGIPKAKGKMQNETVFWENRERKYIKELCEKREIEIHELGEKRDNYTIPEYKKAIRKAEVIESQAEKLEAENRKMEKRLERYQISEAVTQIAEKEAGALERKAAGEAVPVKGIFDKEDQVRVPTRIWKQILKAYKWAKTKEKLISRLEEEIRCLRQKLTMQEEKIKMMEMFLKEKGMDKMFHEYMSPEKKSVMEKLRNKEKEISGSEKAEGKKKDKHFER